MTLPYVPPVYDVEAQHNNTEHLSINNTFIRRTLTRLAQHTTAKFYPRDGLCSRISRNKILKTGRRIHLTEAATMKYLAENTTIPVPKVYCSFLHKNRAHVVMERIKGNELARVWGTMSESSRKGILTQLREMIQQLRALKPPPDTGVESCVGGSLYDSRIPRGTPRFGPFKTIQEFHFWLRHDLIPESLKDRKRDQDWYDAHEMMSLQDGLWARPIFSHGDLSPWNIIVDGDKVTGIIDWEFSGWYPSYWEYTSAWFSDIMREDWQVMLDEILDRPSPEVFKMEEVRNKWWGQ